MNRTGSRPIEFFQGLKALSFRPTSFSPRRFRTRAIGCRSRSQEQ